jgi:hypothetical protein
MQKIVYIVLMVCFNQLVNCAPKIDEENDNSLKSKII